MESNNKSLTIMKIALLLQCRAILWWAVQLLGTHLKITQRQARESDA